MELLTHTATLVGLATVALAAYTVAASRQTVEELVPIPVKVDRWLR